MSDIPLYDGDENMPAPLGKDEVRFTEASVRPYPDGRRMKLSFGLTPFQHRPSVDVSVTNADGAEVASMSLIEAMDTNFDFTLHLRGPEPRGEHTLHMLMFYPEGDDPAAGRQVVDERRLSFSPDEARSS